MPDVKPIIIDGVGKREYDPSADTIAGLSDIHSGYYEISFGLDIEILEFKQMTNWGGLILEGNLFVEGQIILEA